MSPLNLGAEVRDIGNQRFKALSPQQECGWPWVARAALVDSQQKRGYLSPSTTRKGILPTARMSPEISLPQRLQVRTRTGQLDSNPVTWSGERAETHGMRLVTYPSMSY